MKVNNLRTLLLPLSLATLLAACDNGNNNRPDMADNPVPAPAPPPEPTMMSFDITVTNLTHNQPLSPVIAAVHGGDLLGWAIGEASSNGLELLAESGDNSEFMMEFDAAGSFASTSAESPLGPGATETLSLSFAEEDQVMLTLASMLGNTNDAFTGVTGMDLSSLAIGESMQLQTPVFDAGTELNSELPGTIPGPADGGEGFNADRDDVDFVAYHGGVVTRADGYAESALDQSHRFDQPAAVLKITRTE